MAVQRALESYGRENAQLGLRERSAKLLREAKRREMIQQLEYDINQQASSLTQCPSVSFPRSLRCNIRDSAHVLYIWYANQNKLSVQSVVHPPAVPCNALLDTLRGDRELPLCQNPEQTLDAARRWPLRRIFIEVGSGWRHVDLVVL